jgi:hypothetical protein
MPREQPDEFFTGIATGANDGDGFEIHAVTLEGAGPDAKWQM